MTTDQKFDTWLLTDYREFRHRMFKVLKKPVPNEHSQLMMENQDLPPMLAEAHEHRAFACSQYVKTKEAKLPSHEKMWAREHTTGTCESIRERLNAVARMLKVLDTEKY